MNTIAHELNHIREILGDVDHEALRVDTGRGPGGDVRRYRVHRAELARLDIGLR